MRVRACAERSLPCEAAISQASRCPHRRYSTVAVTDAAGRFVAPNLPTIGGELVVVATVAGGLSGVSFPIKPVRGGTTDVGNIVLRPQLASIYPGLKFATGDGPVSVAFADVDLDGVADFVTANQRSNDISILLGNGNGTFEAARSFTTGDEPVSVATA